MPAARIRDSRWDRNGTPAVGSIGFGVDSVSGRSLVPLPPTSTTASAPGSGFAWSAAGGWSLMPAILTQSLHNVCTSTKWATRGPIRRDFPAGDHLDGLLLRGARAHHLTVWAPVEQEVGD